MYQFLQLSISGHLDSCFQFYKQGCCNYFVASLGVNTNFHFYWVEMSFWINN